MAKKILPNSSDKRDERCRRCSRSVSGFVKTFQTASKYANVHHQGEQAEQAA